MLMTERLKAARKECKLTQQQVADILGIDRSTYAYYELGVSNPSIENLIALSAVFKTDINWLIGADRGDDAFRSPENEFSLVKAVKEKQMTELSKDERQIVALYRIAGVYGNCDNIFRVLKEAAEKSDDEE